jgi:catechol 2,3-dioxygenase-like lactoylglutathione lyase family enzyme
MGRIRHIAIATRDLEATTQFYMEGLGLKQVGKVNTPTSEGYYLSDGDLNLDAGCRALGPITGVALESSSTNERLRQSCAHVYENWRSVLEEKDRVLAAKRVPRIAAW